MSTFFNPPGQVRQSGPSPEKRRIKKMADKSDRMAASKGLMRLGRFNFPPLGAIMDIPRYPAALQLGSSFSNKSFLKNVTNSIGILRSSKNTSEDVRAIHCTLFLLVHNK